MIDRYTKAVLTVIAACLLVITFRTTAGPAAAQSGPVHVILDSVGTYAFQFVDLKVHQ